LANVSVQPTGQSPLDARAREVENLAAAVRRLEREKRALQEWTATLERTVVAHEQVGRDREAERVAEVRVRTQELAAVERRLARTLESQSFRLGHLLIRISVSPVKALRWTRRHVRTVAVRGYRLAQRRLPGYVVDPVQRVATRGQLATARRHEVLDLAGDRPVSFVDCRGLEELARDALWARIAASDQPDRTVVLVDSPDFTDLRTLGLSFEYLPPYRPDLPWWCDEADHARWVEDRMAAMRLGYGVEDDAGH